jgi:hypothetical protein
MFDMHRNELVFFASLLILLLIGSQGVAQAQPNIDSLSSTQIQVQNPADTIIQSVSRKLSNATTAINRKIDSLNSINLPPNEHAEGLRSLYKRLQNSITNLRDSTDKETESPSKSFDYLDSLVTSKTRLLDSLIQANQIQGLNDRLPSSPSFDMKIPDQWRLSDLNQPTGISKNRLGVNSLPSVGDQTLSIPELLPDNVIPNVSEEVQQMSDVKTSVTSGDVDQIINQQAVNAGPLRETKQLIDQSKNVGTEVLDASQSANPEKLKTEFKDYLAGKEEIVKKDLEDIGKLQVKYRDVSDSRLLPKRPPNAMKGKPFIERLIPGVDLQVLHGENVSINFAPMVGYRFSGRIRAGVSAYRGLTYVSKDDALRMTSLYGVRLSNNIRVIKQVYTHIEVEKFKADPFAQQVFLKHAAPQSKFSWDTKLNFGALQIHPIGKRINTHFLVLYDLLMLKQFPNSNGSSVRFGFDYQLRKREKKS